MFLLRLFAVVGLLGCNTPVGGVSELGPSGLPQDAGPVADAGAEPQSAAVIEDFADGGSASAVDGGAVTTPRRLPPIAHDDRSVDAAIRAWRDRFQSVGDVLNPDQLACVERFERLEVIVPDNTQFRRLCQRCNTVDDHSACDRLGRIFACAAVQYDAAYVVLDPSMAEVERKRVALTIHETIHHLGMCTDEDGDPGHAQHDWWCGQPDGCIEGEAFADVMWD